MRAAAFASHDTVLMLNCRHDYCAPPSMGGIKRCFRLTSVCLSVCLSDASLTSVACIWPKSRIDRPMKTKTGSEVAHVTHDSDTTLKVKGQGHQAALLTAVLARQAPVAVGMGTCWP